MRIIILLSRYTQTKRVFILTHQFVNSKKSLLFSRQAKVLQTHTHRHNQISWNIKWMCSKFSLVILRSKAFRFLKWTWKYFAEVNQNYSTEVAIDIWGTAFCLHPLLAIYICLKLSRRPFFWRNSPKVSFLFTT